MLPLSPKQPGIYYVTTWLQTYDNPPVSASNCEIISMLCYSWLRINFMSFVILNFRINFLISTQRKMFSRDIPKHISLDCVLYAPWLSQILPLFLLASFFLLKIPYFVLFCFGFNVLYWGLLFHPACPLWTLSFLLIVLFYFYTLYTHIQTHTHLDLHIWKRTYVFVLLNLLILLIVNSTSIHFLSNITSLQLSKIPLYMPNISFIHSSFDRI